MVGCDDNHYLMCVKYIEKERSEELRDRESNLKREAPAQQDKSAPEVDYVEKLEAQMLVYFPNHSLKKQLFQYKCQSEALSLQLQNYKNELIESVKIINDLRRHVSKTVEHSEHSLKKYNRCRSFWENTRRRQIT